MLLRKSLKKIFSGLYHQDVTIIHTFSESAKPCYLSTPHLALVRQRLYKILHSHPIPIWSTKSFSFSFFFY